MKNRFYVHGDLFSAEEPHHTELRNKLGGGRLYHDALSDLAMPAEFFFCHPWGYPLEKHLKKYRDHKDNLKKHLSLGAYYRPADALNLFEEDLWHDFRAKSKMKKEGE